MSFDQACYLFADAYPSIDNCIELQQGLQACNIEQHFVLREPFREAAVSSLLNARLDVQLHVVPAGCRSLVSQLLYIHEELDERRTLMLTGSNAFGNPSTLLPFLAATETYQAVLLASESVEDEEDCAPGVRCNPDGIVEELTGAHESEFYRAEGALCFETGSLAINPAMQAICHNRPKLENAELLMLINDAILQDIEVIACDKQGRLIHGRVATHSFEAASVQFCKAI